MEFLCSIPRNPEFVLLSDLINDFAALVKDRRGIMRLIREINHKYACLLLRNNNKTFGGASISFRRNSFKKLENLLVLYDDMMNGDWGRLLEARV
jgi:hypothetical protein